jgi:hypothetical protein
MIWRMAQDPIAIETVQQFVDNGYTLGSWCPVCRHHGEIDLARLVAEGHADKFVSALYLACKDCGAIVRTTLRPPSRHRRNRGLMRRLP